MSPKFTKAYLKALYIINNNYRVNFLQSISFFKKNKRNIKKEGYFNNHIFINNRYLNNQNKRIKKAVKSYLRNLNKKFNISKSILFGSRVKGDYLDTSDVDLIVVSKDFSKLNFRKRMAEAIEDWDEAVDLEIICYTPEEFEKKKKQIGIVKTAVEEGVEV